MCSKKKDLEIICNLQWKTKPYNGGERSNIIGVYDVPSTTLNWEIFKSYLLKNSGTPGDDVKVSYLATNDKEFPIQSQLDFQIALYAFRKKARNGEIINLKLDRISHLEKAFKKSSTSNDVQTQFDNDGAGCSSSPATMDIAPQWFTDYMTEFKKAIINEVSATVSSYVSTIKSHGVQSYHSRKTKTESNKRTRKHPLILCEVGNEKEFLKTLKLEKKVETKLEKLENKSKKLKEKKMSLLTKSSDSDAGQSSSKSTSDMFTVTVDDITKMNAAPVRQQQSVVPHMMGGEVYLHTWDVINNGSLPWTSETELHFTWGSASLEPVERSVPCPPLKPGESGSINVLLNVPKNCGQYESYWYFHHKGRKFGHWLGCQIIVDKVNSAEPSTHGFINSYQHLKSRYDSVFAPAKSVMERKTPQKEILAAHVFNVDINKEAQTETASNIIDIVEEKTKELHLSNCSSEAAAAPSTVPDQFIFVTRAPSPSQDVLREMKQATPEVPANIEEIVLNASPSKIQVVEKAATDEPEPCDLECDANDFQEPNQNKHNDVALESDDNNNNTEGGQDSCSESISKIDEETTSNSTLNDMVMVNFSDDMEEHDTGYAYVVVDGIKVPIPKKYLRSDFLETAEDAPEPTLDPKISEKSEENNQDRASLERFNKEEIDGVQNREESEAGQAEVKVTQQCPPPAFKVEPFLYQNKNGDYKLLMEEARKMNESYTVPSAPVVTDSSTSTVQNSMMNSRMFVFPQDCPGYEIVPSQPIFAEAQMAPESNWSESRSKYAFSNTDLLNSQFMKCNPYQQEPHDMNGPYQYHQFHPYCQSVFTNAPSQHVPQRVDSSAAPNGFPNMTVPPNYYPFNTIGSNGFPYVPNFQQTPPEFRTQLNKEDEHVPVVNQESASSGLASGCSNENSQVKEDKHIRIISPPSPVPAAPMASVVSGAMTMASSALNTAKNVVNMIIPDRNETKQGHWVNGHWVSANAETPREANLKALADMGFWDRDLNATLLARYNDDIAQVVADLIQ